MNGKKLIEGLNLRRRIFANAEITEEIRFGIFQGDEMFWKYVLENGNVQMK